MSTNTYTGGLGDREGGDLVRWKLEIEDHLRQAAYTGSPYPVMVREREPEAELTLYDVTRDECIKVISILNIMRSGPNIPTPEQRAPSIGDRFSGLELPSET
jgi:hypothetical protein